MLDNIVKSDTFPFIVLWTLRTGRPQPNKPNKKYHTKYNTNYKILKLNVIDIIRNQINQFVNTKSILVMAQMHTIT